MVTSELNQKANKTQQPCQSNSGKNWHKFGLLGKEIPKKECHYLPHVCVPSTQR